jgi:hypothetical protein
MIHYAKVGKAEEDRSVLCKFDYFNFFMVYLLLDAILINLYFNKLYHILPLCWGVFKRPILSSPQWDFCARQQNAESLPLLPREGNSLGSGNASPTEDS